jgi:predicted phage tail protein
VLATTFTYDAVPPGWYFLRIRAMNAAGDGLPTPEVLIASGGGAAPPGPPALRQALVSGRTVNLEWAAGTGGGAASRYRLEVGSARERSDVATFTTPLASTAIGFTNVPAGYVRIRGVNLQGAGPVSNEIRIDVP